MIKKMKGGLYCLLFFFVLFTNTAQDLEIVAVKEVKSPTYGQVILKGLPKSDIKQLGQMNLSNSQWDSFFNIKVEGATRAVLGTYATSDDGVVFTPRFLPDSEVEYNVNFSSERLKNILPDFNDSWEETWPLTFSNLAGEMRNKVVAITPDVTKLPSNVLRVYIHFSNTMSFANPYEYLELVDEKGMIIPDAFVEIEEGLWNQDRTRLTVLFHPGRIKRGVGPNLTQGQIFEVGKEYSIRISPQWKSASGNAMAKPYQKDFKISKSIRNRIVVENWVMDAPQAGSKEPLAIDLVEIIDLPIARRTIDLFDGKGHEIEGIIDFEDGKLTFSPKANWKKGKYSIRIDQQLEDVCGNTPLTVFDLVTSGKKKESVIIPDLSFQVD